MLGCLPVQSLRFVRGVGRGGELGVGRRNGNRSVAGTVVCDARGKHEYLRHLPQRSLVSGWCAF